MEKIDKFAILAVSAILVLALLIVYTVNSLFGAFFISQKVVDPEVAQQESFLNEQKLDEAHKVFENRQNVQLDLKL